MKSLSKIIKASQIKGEYKIDEDTIIKAGQKTKKKKKPSPQKKAAAKNKELEQVKAQIIDQAEQQAEGILENAREKAEKIRENAEQEAEKARNQGYEDGYQKGLVAGEEEGRKKAQTEFKNLMENFEVIVRETQEALERDAKQLQGQIISLAVNIGEKIVNTELEINPELINNIISDILEDMSDFTKIDIHVNSEIFDYIDNGRFQSEYVKQKINFKGDQNMKPGDCVVETYLGGRDGTIDNKLNQIEKELLKGAGFHDGS